MCKWPRAHIVGHLLYPSAVVSAFRQLMREDGERLGLSIGRASGLIGVWVREYRALEDGESYPDFETWDRICKLYGWPQAWR
jgi:hypothetical protein